jgi:hypothetical protein
MKRLFTIAILTLCCAAAFAKDKPDWFTGKLAAVEQQQASREVCSQADAIAVVCSHPLYNVYTVQLDDVTMRLTKSYDPWHKDVLDQAVIGTLVRFYFTGYFVAEGVKHFHLQVTVDGKHKAEFTELWQSTDQKGTQ